jgi:hypothetical protein
MEGAMHHPVYMAFFYGSYFDPERQTVVGPWPSRRLALVYSSLALLLFVAIAIGTSTSDPQAGATERAGPYDRIIAGETRKPNEQAMNEGVRQ